MSKLLECDFMFKKKLYKIAKEGNPYTIEHLHLKFDEIAQRVANLEGSDKLQTALLLVVLGGFISLIVIVAL